MNKSGSFKIIKILQSNFYIIFLSLTIALVISLNGCAKCVSPTTISGFYFNTFIQITIYDEVSDDIKENITKICEKYDTMFSPTKEGSELYLINTQKETTVSNEMVQIISDEIKYSKETEGIIDPTIQSIYALWDFSGSSPIVPSDTVIKQQLEYVDCNKITINENTITKDNINIQLTLGYMAKGYIADQIAQYLINNNINNAIINLGGNILCLGNKNNNEKYTIGIEKPFESGQSILTLNISADKNPISIVTSGCYERCFEANGNLYHHLLDTTTGYPVNNGIYSVTIIGPHSTMCDKLSTALYLMGKEKGLNFIKSYPDYSAIFIDSDYNITYSDNFDLNKITE